jgi:hypothetical protein
VLRSGTHRPLPPHERGDARHSGSAARTRVPSAYSESPDAHRARCARTHAVQLLQIANHLGEYFPSTRTCQLADVRGHNGAILPRQCHGGFHVRAHRQCRHPERVPASPVQAARIRVRAAPGARPRRQFGRSDHPPGARSSDHDAGTRRPRRQDDAWTSSGSVNTGSPLRLPDVATSAAPKSSSNRWCSGL